MNTWRKRLAATFGEGHIVTIDRTPEIEDMMEGYAVGVSELFVMLHALDGDYINLNGYTVLRVQDITRYRIRDDGDFFMNRALKLKGIHPAPLPEIDLSNFPALLVSANAQFPLITLHREIMDEQTCFIGQVQKVTDKTVTLREIDRAAEWNRTHRFNFKDITRVDFGGGYEEALALVAEDEARKLLNPT